MKFGLCCDAQHAPIALSAGFDYVELPAHRLRDLDCPPTLPIESTNLFFPGNVKLFDPKSPSAILVGIETIEQAAAFGVRTMVIGSGGTRNAPEGVDTDEGELKFCDVVAELQRFANQFDIRLAPESLNRSETNVGNSLVQLACRLQERGVGYTADAYHVLYEWKAENPDTSVPDRGLWEEQLPFAPTHIHVADLDRHPPRANDPQLAGFVARLSELGYNGRVSLEAGVREESLERVCQDLRSLFS